MTKIILSFDHELPLGGVNQSFEHALFSPTRKVLEAADQEKVKVCLFTDILSYVFFRKHHVIEFTEPYVKQLQDAVKSGHDVQLHLHPHWMKTQYDQGRFFPSADFALADFAQAEYPENLEGIIELGIHELNTICKAVNPDYQCLAFRAGGFNLEPETGRILKALYINGIRIDSSIPKGFYYRSAFSTIHYKHMPWQNNWHIPLNGPLSATAEEGMYEIPIATIPAGLWTNLKHLYYKRKHKHHAYVSGKTIHAGKVNKLDKLRFVFSVRMLGFDTYSMAISDLMRILSYNIEQHKSEQELFFSSVSHPKNMGPYAIDLMKGFICAARNKYPDLQFVIYPEVLSSHKI